MKVMCILDEDWFYCDRDELSEGPKFKEICTVASTVVCKDCGVIAYILSGYDKDDFHAEHFIPLDDLREIIKEEEQVSQITEIIKPMFSPVPVK